MTVVKNCHTHILYMLIYRLAFFKKMYYVDIFLKNKASKIKTAFLMTIVK